MSDETKGGDGAGSAAPAAAPGAPPESPTAARRAGAATPAATPAARAGAEAEPRWAKFRVIPHPAWPADAPEARVPAQFKTIDFLPLRFDVAVAVVRRQCRVPGGALVYAGREVLAQAAYDAMFEDWKRGAGERRKAEVDRKIEGAKAVLGNPRARKMEVMDALDDLWELAAFPALHARLISQVLGEVFAQVLKSPSLQVRTRSLGLLYTMVTQEPNVKPMLRGGLLATLVDLMQQLAGRAAQLRASNLATEATLDSLKARELMRRQKAERATRALAGDRDLRRGGVAAAEAAPAGSAATGAGEAGASASKAPDSSVDGTPRSGAATAVDSTAEASEAAPGAASGTPRSTAGKGIGAKAASFGGSTAGMGDPRASTPRSDFADDVEDDDSFDITAAVQDMSEFDYTSEAGAADHGLKNLFANVHQLAKLHEFTAGVLFWVVIVPAGREAMADPSSNVVPALRGALVTVHEIREECEKAVAISIAMRKMLLKKRTRFISARARLAMQKRNAGRSAGAKPMRLKQRLRNAGRAMSVKDVGALEVERKAQQEAVIMLKELEAAVADLHDSSFVVGFMHTRREISRVLCYLLAHRDTAAAATPQLMQGLGLVKLGLMPPSEEGEAGLAEIRADNTQWGPFAWLEVLLDQVVDENDGGTLTIDSSICSTVLSRVCGMATGCRLLGVPEILQAICTTIDVVRLPPDPQKHKEFVRMQTARQRLAYTVEDVETSANVRPKVKSVTGAGATHLAVAGDASSLNMSPQRGAVAPVGPHHLDSADRRAYLPRDGASRLASTMAIALWAGLSTLLGVVRASVAPRRGRRRRQRLVTGLSAEEVSVVLHHCLERLVMMARCPRTDIQVCAIGAVAQLATVESRELLGVEVDRLYTAVDTVTMLRLATQKRARQVGVSLLAQLLHVGGHAVAHQVLARGAVGLVTDLAVEFTPEPSPEFARHGGRSPLASALCSLMHLAYWHTLSSAEGMGPEMVRLCARWLALDNVDVLSYTTVLLFSCMRNMRARAEAWRVGCDVALVDFVNKAVDAFHDDSTPPALLAKYKQALELCLGALWMMNYPRPPPHFAVGRAITAEEADELEAALTATAAPSASPPPQAAVLGGEDDDEEEADAKEGGAEAGGGGAAAASPPPMNSAKPSFRRARSSRRHEKALRQAAPRSPLGRSPKRTVKTGSKGDPSIPPPPRSGTASLGSPTKLAAALAAGAANETPSLVDKSIPDMPALDIFIDVTEIPELGMGVAGHLALENVWRMLVNTTKHIRRAARYNLIDVTVIDTLYRAATDTESNVSIRLLSAQILYELRPTHTDGARAALIAREWEEGAYRSVELLAVSLCHYDEDMHLQAFGVHMLTQLTSRDGPRRRLQQLGIVETLSVLLEESMQRQLERRLHVMHGGEPPQPDSGHTSHQMNVMADAVLTEILQCLLNLSVENDCMPQIGRYVFDALLYIFQQSPTTAGNVVAMAKRVMSNIARHPANRTRMYKAELRLNYVESGGVTGEFATVSTPRRDAREGHERAGSELGNVDDGDESAANPAASDPDVVRIHYLEKQLDASAQRCRLRKRLQLLRIGLSDYQPEKLRARKGPKKYAQEGETSVIDGDDMVLGVPSGGGSTRRSSRRSRPRSASGSSATSRASRRRNAGATVTGRGSLDSPAPVRPTAGPMVHGVRLLSAADRREILKDVRVPLSKDGGVYLGSLPPHVYAAAKQDSRGLMGRPQGGDALPPVTAGQRVVSSFARLRGAVNPSGEVERPMPLAWERLASLKRPRTMAELWTPPVGAGAVLPDTHPNYDPGVARAQLLEAGIIRVGDEVESHNKRHTPKPSSAALSSGGDRVVPAWLAAGINTPKNPEALPFKTLRRRLSRNISTVWNAPHVGAAGASPRVDGGDGDGLSAAEPFRGAGAAHGTDAGFGMPRAPSRLDLGGITVKPPGGGAAAAAHGAHSGGMQQVELPYYGNGLGRASEGVLLAAPALIRPPTPDSDHEGEDAANISLLAKQDQFVHVPGARFCDMLFEHYELPDGRSLHFSKPREPLYEVRSEPYTPERPGPWTLEDIGQAGAHGADAHGHHHGAHGGHPGLFPPPPDAAAHRLSDLPPAYMPEKPSLPPWCINNPLFSGSCPPFMTPQVPRDLPVDVDVWRAPPPPPPDPDAPPEPPFDLTKSVFAPRRKEAPCRDFYDTRKLFKLSFKSDWERIWQKGGFQRTMTKPYEGDATQAQAFLRRAIELKFEVLSDIYDYFCCRNSDQENFCILMNAFTEFVMLCKLPDPNSDSESKCKLSDIDRLFVLCNYEEKTANKEDNKANQDRALMRFEFLEMLVRMGIAKFEGRTARPLLPHEAFNKLCAEYVLPVCTPLCHDRNSFRRERLYTRPVNDFYKHIYGAVKKLHALYCPLQPGSSKKAVRSGLPAWLKFLTDAQLLDDTFTVREARYVFTWSRMRAVDELKKRDITATITLTDFLECLGRVADMKWLPSNDQLDAAVPARNVYKFFRDGHQVAARAAEAELESAGKPTAKDYWTKVGTLSSLFHEMGQALDDAERHVGGGLGLQGDEVRGAADGLGSLSDAFSHGVTITRNPDMPLEERLDMLWSLITCNLEVRSLQETGNMPPDDIGNRPPRGPDAAEASV